MGSRGQSPPEADKATLQGGLHAFGVLVRLWRTCKPQAYSNQPEADESPAKKPAGKPA